MCNDAAKTLELQCGREYGFGSLYGKKKRGTDLASMSVSDLQHMPTDNVIAEREFAKFDHVSQVAKYRNRFFSAKGIRSDMMLYRSTNEVIMQAAKAAQTLLNAKEKNWNLLQKDQLAKSIQEKIQKKSKSDNYITKILQRCKSWNGPVVTVDCLLNIIKNNKKDEARIVKTELTYYRHTHVNEFRSNPELFKLQGKGVSHETRLENLCVILADNNVNETITELP